MSRHVRKSPSGNCPLCGTYRERLQRDHVTNKRDARELGWTDEEYNDESNIQYICANCHEDKTRVEQSEATKGRVRPDAEEIRQRLIARNKSPEHREKVRESMRGNKLGVRKDRENESTETS